MLRNICVKKNTNIGLLLFKIEQTYQVKYFMSFHIIIGNLQIIYIIYLYKLLKDVTYFGVNIMIAVTYSKGQFHVIKIKDVLNLTSKIDELEDIVNKLLEKNITKIAIHFNDGSYLCSSSGAVLIRCWETIKEHNGFLALVNVNQDIRDFLKIIDFDSLIKIFASEKELESIIIND